MSLKNHDEQVKLNLMIKKWKKIADYWNYIYILLKQLYIIKTNIYNGISYKNDYDYK